ncbi:MAG: chitobiase/beta-hexosaminidase C-terminal domain-containing protein [Acidobacteriota bacterium]
MNLQRISLVVALCAAGMLQAQAAAHNSLGTAWRVQGTWHLEGSGAPVVAGDAIPAGALLQPTVENTAHSITVLLPDGQVILNECFTAADCKRGFQVPGVFRQPDPFAVDMLARIRAVLVRDRGHSSAGPANQLHVAEDEAVSVLGPANQIEVRGIASKLPNGEYFGDLASVDHRYPTRSAIRLQKSGLSVELAVPGPGLYLLTVSDSMKWPRIQTLIAVVTAQDKSVANAFHEQHALLAKWIDEFLGWPMHDFQRAFLKSLMLNIKPAKGSDARMPIASSQDAGVTAEPTFSPRPGFVAGNLGISLHCATAGAVIHYSVDTSQPLETSPVYRAPVMMTNLPLTIKAFASSPGKKDSPVVTGIFRIRQ